MNDVVDKFLELSGWKVANARSGHCYLKRSDGLKLHLSEDYSRVTATLSDVQRTITLSRSKSPDKIVDEIQRRLISKHEDEWVELLEQRRIDAEDEAARLSTIEKLASLFGSNTKEYRHGSSAISKFFTNNKHYLFIQIDRPDCVTLTIRSIHSDIAAKIIELVKD